MKSKPDIAVLVINFNEPSITESCLSSVIESDKSVDIYVLDNSLDEKFKPKVYRFFSNINLIRVHDNLGFAKTANIGLRKILKNNYKTIFLLNNDTRIIQKNTFKSLSEVLHSKTHYGLISPRIITPKNEIWFECGKIDPNRYSAGHIKNQTQRSLYSCEFVSGCCMGIKSELLKKVGSFDPRFYLYYEDADLCLRAKKIGFKSIVFSDIEIVHEGSYSSKKSAGKAEYYIERSRLFFLAKHAPLGIKIREAVRLPKTIIEYLSTSFPGQKFKALIDFLLNKTEKNKKWK